MDKLNSNKSNRKVIYFFLGCILLSMIIVGATFAYFVANATDDSTVAGGTYTTNFSLSVTKVTTVDMAFGLLPMKNSESPHAALQMCRDDYGNAGCQIYKITVTTDSDDVFFVDGYIILTNKEGIETRFTKVTPKKIVDEDTGEESNVFSTSYTKEDLNDTMFDVDNVIKNGLLTNSSQVVENMNNTDNYNCLLTHNEKIGGDNKSVDIYFMIWVYDNGQDQNDIQGMELAYNGLAVFNTAQGNEIKATFD